MEHADPNTPYDPSATYPPCCHPRNMERGTVARDTFDAVERANLAAWYAEDAIRRAASDAENAAQQARVEAMNNGN